MRNYSVDSAFNIRVFSCLTFQLVVLVIGPPDWEIPTGAEKNL